jgi:hypothetical protein
MGGNVSGLPEDVSQYVKKKKLKVGFEQISFLNRM